MEAQHAFATAIVYFGFFLAVGIIAKCAVDRWMHDKDFDLSEIQSQAGPNRGKRRLFLLGFWREEGPN
jgi:hypothetical protein